MFLTIRKTYQYTTTTIDWSNIITLIFLIAYIIFTIWMIAKIINYMNRQIHLNEQRNIYLNKQTQLLEEQNELLRNQKD